MTKATHYAQRDSIEIAGKFYKLGEAIDSDVHPAVIQVLTDQGVIADSQPVGGASVPSSVVAIDDMNRLELEEAVLTGSKAKMAVVLCVRACHEDRAAAGQGNNACSVWCSGIETIAGRYERRGRWQGYSLAWITRTKGATCRCLGHR